MSEPVRTAIGAAIFLLCFGVFGYFLPSIMVVLGNISVIVAAVFAVLFVLAFFIVFWIRARLQEKKQK